MKDSPVPKFDLTLTHEDDDEIDLTLKMYRDGRCVLQASDSGEPEDQSFYRDWSWVPDAIRDAYAYGLEDGHADVHRYVKHAKECLSVAVDCVLPVMHSVSQTNTGSKALIEAVSNIDEAMARSAPKEKT